MSAISSSSARDQLASPPPSTVPPKGSTSSWWKRNVAGGQAGASSRIENYLGFSDRHLGRTADRARAYAQAQKFGARIAIANAERTSPVRVTRTP
jgi:thioredoxin reductase